MREHARNGFRGRSRDRGRSSTGVLASSAGRAVDVAKLQDATTLRPPFSSYTWKALIALTPTAPRSSSARSTRRCRSTKASPARRIPSGQFPVLVDGDTIVVETSAIIEHLAVHHPGPAPLIPADPAEAVTRACSTGCSTITSWATCSASSRPTSSTWTTRAAGGLRDEPYAPEIAAGKAGLREPMRGSSAGWRRTRCRRTCRWSTCAAAPSLFYADWVEPIRADRPRLGRLPRRVAGAAAGRRAASRTRVPFARISRYGAPDRD